MAQLFLDNLDRGRKIYVEYSNEVWNSGLTNAFWHAYEQGTALGLRFGRIHDRRPLLRVPGPAALHDLEQGVEGGRSFGGSSSSSPASRATTGSRRNRHISVMNDAKLNPSGMRPDAYAVAPYVGHDIVASAPNADPISELIAVFHPRCGQRGKQGQVRRHRRGDEVLRVRGGAAYARRGGPGGANATSDEGLLPTVLRRHERRVRGVRPLRPRRRLARGVGGVAARWTSSDRPIRAVATNTTRLRSGWPPTRKSGARRTS